VVKKLQYGLEKLSISCQVLKTQQDPDQDSRFWDRDQNQDFTLQDKAQNSKIKSQDVSRSRLELWKLHHWLLLL